MASLIWATAIYFPTKMQNCQVRDVIRATGFWADAIKPELDAYLSHYCEMGNGGRQWGAGGANPEFAKKM